MAADKRFAHVMAITLDPRTQYREGAIRCVTSREGDVTVGGNIDKSELHTAVAGSLENFEIGEKVNMKDEAEIISSLKEEGLDFIGMEDPDIWIDERNDEMHLYFTLPFINRVDSYQNIIHLGHAVGKNLNSLRMTTPALLADAQGGAKELSVAPINSKGVRLNLVESSMEEYDRTYSVVRLAIAQDMGRPWKFGEIVFHPKEQKTSWIGGHASPGPLLPESFIDLGEGKRLGLMNGRGADQIINGKFSVGKFSVGLFIYDYEYGKIDWVSPVPFIQDSEAKAMTFASQFVETGDGEGILYAHVDDSFVRAYTLEAELLTLMLAADSL